MILDSSILIAAERLRFDLTAFLADHTNEDIQIASITASELLHGCARATDPRIRQRRLRSVEDTFLDYAVAPFTLIEAREHARLWVELETSGSRIGPHDMLIAATALTLGFSVATLNTAEFQRVPGLQLVDVARFRRPAAGQK